MWQLCRPWRWPQGRQAQPGGQVSPDDPETHSVLFFYFFYSLERKTEQDRGIIPIHWLISHMPVTAAAAGAEIRNWELSLVTPVEGRPPMT